MPARQHPAPARAGQVVVVQLKGRNRGAPNGRAPNNVNTVGTPAEVFMPVLPTWIEQRYLLTGFWIGGMGLGGFVAVTERTSQPQIANGRRAARSHGDNVLHMHGHGGELLRCQTVTAPVASRGGHTTAHGGGNIGS